MPLEAFGKYILLTNFNNYVDIFCDNLRRYARGESLTHVVDTAAGY